MKPVAGQLATAAAPGDMGMNGMTAMPMASMRIIAGRCVVLLCCLVFWLRAALGVGQAILGAAVAHQVAQVADAHARHFVHADQQRSANRQAVVTDLADDGWRDFEHARQRSVVFQLHLAQQNIEQVIGVVWQFVSTSRVSMLS